MAKNTKALTCEKDVEEIDKLLQIPFLAGKEGSAWSDTEADQAIDLISRLMYT